MNKIKTAQRDSPKIEIVPIMQLTAYENNSRVHSEKQLEKLQASIREFGFIKPVLVDENYMILAGHGAVQAAQNENLDKVPCYVVSGLTEAQKRAYVIADNRLTDISYFDMSIVISEIGELQTEDFNTDVTGFDTDVLLDDDLSTLDPFFTAKPQKDEKKKKTLLCPYCGKELEI